MSTVLIVDDAADNRYFLRCLLSADGYQIVEANGGIEALARARDCHIDLVVSDILMPGMDGFSLCREWQKDAILRQIPFVFYTATYTDERDAAFARSLGAADYIVKPITPQLLRQRVRDAMLRSRCELTSGECTEPIEDLPYLREYNEVLVRKLEDKVVQLEQANQSLLLKDLALACSVSGVLFCDVGGVVTYANAAMIALCRDLTANLIGMALENILGVPADWIEWVKYGQGGRQFEAPLQSHVTTANSPWLRISAHRIVTNEGRYLGVMLSCIDISEEQRLREELSRAQRLEALSLFAAGVAHDFNNLLMGIYAGLELDAIGGQNSSDREEYRAMALAAFERAKDLTRRLLTFSKGSVGKMGAVNLCQLLDEEVSLALSGSGVRCVKNYATQKAIVHADAGQLGQVFSNLLINARQAMSDSGTIVIAVERQVAGPGHSGADRTQEGIQVKITDDGPGISPEVLPNIFEPYFTTKSQGSGLGLATSLTIVRQHNGSIEVSSAVGAGTTFVLRFPISNDTGEIPPVPTRNALPRGSGRILVMDDQVVIQAILQRTLERAGYSAEVVSNGEQAILEFTRASNAGHPFDLLILDITVRGAMGGIDTLKALRREGHIVPAIASTGYCDAAAAAQLKAEGFSHVLGKPFPTHELLSLVKAILGRNSPSKAP